MDSWIIPVGYALLAVVTLFLVAVAAFFLWLGVTWGAWAYRYLTRRHRYVPVTATVTKVWYDRLWWLRKRRFHEPLAQVGVSYEHGGKTFENRLNVPRSKARHVETTGFIQLKVDPAYPYDILPA